MNKARVRRPLAYNAVLYAQSMCAGAARVIGYVGMAVLGLAALWFLASAFIEISAQPLIMTINLAVGISLVTLLFAAAALVIATFTTAVCFMRFRLTHLVSCVMYFGLCVALCVRLEHGLRILPLFAAAIGVVVLFAFILKQDPTREERAINQ